MNSLERRGGKKQEETLDRWTFKSPYAEAAIKAYTRRFESEATPGRQEMVREIVYTFMTETLQNTRLHEVRDPESPNSGIKYPYGMIDTGILTKKIYEQITGKKVGNLRAPEDALKQKRKEFIFGSLLFPMHGTSFMYQEEPLHEFIKTLQIGIEAIERGEEPSSVEVYTIGSPTNLLGTMTDKFLAEMNDKGAFTALGALYAEHIKSLVADSDPSLTNIHLIGQSIGGAIAAETGKKLLDNNVVTQVTDKHKTDADRNKPDLYVRIEAAPASTHTPDGLKNVQIRAGFILEGARALLSQRYLLSVIPRERAFVRDINKILASRSKEPLLENMNPDQEKMKLDGLRRLKSNVTGGQPLPAGLKVTEVVGLHDIETFSPLFTAKAVGKRTMGQVRRIGGRKRPLDNFAVTTEGENAERRRRGANMGHVRPFYRENELKRLDRAAQILERARGINVPDVVKRRFKTLTDFQAGVNALLDDDKAKVGHAAPPEVRKRYRAAAEAIWLGQSGGLEGRNLIHRLELEENKQTRRNLQR